MPSPLDNRPAPQDESISPGGAVPQRLGPRADKRLGWMLCGVFFLSGASALIFETLWFRLAGLTFGNTVWASALVLSAFMAGMALGNGLAAWKGRRIVQPVRVYAMLEMVIAVTGIGLVLVFPFLTEWLAPLFRTFLDVPVILNPLRLLISFGLLLIPATAMGMTLPLLVKALYEEAPNFGRVLGGLYGWNTLGAVTGAILPELILIELFGVRGTAYWAGLFNFVAAAGALYLARHTVNRFKDPPAPADHIPVTWARVRKVAALLAAGFLCGAILLGLEVVWVRLLVLYLNAYSFVFSLMLATVLAGIALGGLAGGLWFRFHARAYHHLTWLACLAGALSVLSYVAMDFVIAFGRPELRVVAVLSLALPLMFPVSFVSGMVFTLIGGAVHEVLGESTEAAGTLTMVNTMGAMVGSALAGFVLLPELGMEISLFGLSCAYGAVGLSVAWRTLAPASLLHKRLAVAGGIAFLVGMISFPFGAMEPHVRRVGERKIRPGEQWRQAAVSEGLNETIQYWQRLRFGKPMYTVLYTNNHSMSANYVYGRRYMKFFVYLPVALHPDPRKALLVCYGVGATAKALTTSEAFDAIDVVDLSQGILDHSDVVFPQPEENPLNDPRVAVHVEDGRFFLQTTTRRYDLITGEPPPPQLAGIVNLYSQEYFELMRSRLRPGGMVSYWLPIRQLGPASGKSVLKAFYSVFPDCSLWAATDCEWVLIGRKPPRPPVSAQHFERQWRDPLVAKEMSRLGFEKPGQLGATFIMDAETIRAVTRTAQPVTDNYPKRIFLPEKASLDTRVRQDFLYDSAMQARTRFLYSESIASLWPSALRKNTGKYFWVQEVINEAFRRHGTAGLNLDGIHAVLTRTDLRFPVFLLMGGPFAIDTDQVIEQSYTEPAPRTPFLAYSLGLRAVADRQYGRALELFAREDALAPERHAKLTHLRLYLLCLTGRVQAARELVAEANDLYAGPVGQRIIRWLSETFAISLRTTQP